MSADTDTSLCSDLFVFNSTLSKSEHDEDKKILFYHPAPTPLDQQHISIGLCEAVIHFVQFALPLPSTDTPSPMFFFFFTHPATADRPFTTKPIQSLHTEKRAFYLYSPEPDVWWVMVMEKPHSSDRTGAAGRSGGGTLGTQSGAMEAIGREEWTDECMLVVLSTMYRMYRLLHGPIADTLRGHRTEEQLAALDADARAALQETCRQEAVALLRAFLPPLVINLRWDRVDLFTTLAGVHFLPLNKNVYLALQRFVNTLENQFSRICDTTVLYDDHLVWSGLDQDDIRVLYKLYVAHLRAGATDFQPMLALAERLRNPAVRFATGPESLTDPAAPVHELAVYTGPRATRHQLVVHRTGPLALLLLVRDDDCDSGCASSSGSGSGNKTAPEPLARNWYALLDAAIARLLGEAGLAQAVADSYRRKEAFDDQFKYIYFNRMNLALKTSLRHKGADVSPAVMKVLSAMHEQFAHPTDAIGEVIVKTVSDVWVVGRCSEEREFYLVFDKNKDRDVGLVDIYEHVTALSREYFNSIFVAE